MKSIFRVTERVRSWSYLPLLILLTAALTVGCSQPRHTATAKGRAIVYSIDREKNLRFSSLADAQNYVSYRVRAPRSLALGRLHEVVVGNGSDSLPTPLLGKKPLSVQVIQVLSGGPEKPQISRERIRYAKAYIYARPEKNPRNYRAEVAQARSNYFEALPQQKIPLPPELVKINKYPGIAHPPEIIQPQAGQRAGSATPATVEWWEDGIVYRVEGSTGYIESSRRGKPSSLATVLEVARSME